MAYRYGGEEIVVLLANHTPDEGVAVGERVRRSVETLQLEGLSESVTVSVGVAGYVENSRETTTLVVSADKAMYTAKEAGRNRVVCHGKNPDEHTRLPWPLASEGDLVDIVEFIKSPSSAVRADATRQLLNLSYKTVLTHLEPFLDILDRLLRDPEASLRLQGLRVLTGAFTRTERSRKTSVVDRYMQPLLALVRQDPSFEVRAQAMIAIGETGDPRFIEWLLAFACDWDEEPYAKAGIPSGLSGLATSGLARMVRSELRRALEGAITETQKRRLSECLDRVNQAAG